MRQDPEREWGKPTRTKRGEVTTGPLTLEDRTIMLHTRAMCDAQQIAVAAVGASERARVRKFCGFTWLSWLYSSGAPL